MNYFLWARQKVLRYFLWNLKILFFVRVGMLFCTEWEA